MVDDTCVIKDEPDANACGQERYTTVTVAYTFAFPDEGSFIFDLPMCEGHALAMKHRVAEDLSKTLKRKA